MDPEVSSRMHTFLSKTAPNSRRLPVPRRRGAEGGRGGQAVRGGPSWGLFRAAGCHMCGLARPPPAGSAAGDGLRDAVGGGEPKCRKIHGFLVN